MKSNYLIFYSPKWVSTLDTYLPKYIGHEIKLYITSKGEPDRRTKEYKKLMSKKPRYYSGFKAKVKTI